MSTPTTIPFRPVAGYCWRGTRAHLISKDWRMLRILRQCRFLRVCGRMTTATFSGSFNEWIMMDETSLLRDEVADSPAAQSARDLGTLPVPHSAASSPSPAAASSLDRKSTRLNSSHLGISYAV